MPISLCLSIIYVFIPLIYPKIFQHHLVADAVDFESYIVCKIKIKTIVEELITRNY